MSMPSCTQSSRCLGAGMPSDVAEWIGAVRLIQAASDAVRHSPLPSAMGPDHSDVRNSSMLALFTYGLARGIQGSLELEKRAGVEPGLRHLCAGELPTARALRTFRRRHAPDIERALTKVLGMCWTECEHPEGLRPALEAEAQARVRSSIWVDAVNDES